MLHRRRDAVGTRDLADGGGRDPVSEPTQLALDAYYSPAPVLSRQPQDQRSVPGSEGTLAPVA